MTTTDPLGTATATATAVVQEVSDLPPVAYSYRERPADVLEVRATELQTIVAAHVADALRQRDERIAALEEALRAHLAFYAWHMSAPSEDIIAHVTERRAAVLAQTRALLHGGDAA